MLNMRIARDRLGLERCISQAAISPTSEMETMWLSFADSYRWLLEREQLNLKRDSWEHIQREALALKG
jgi:hypothetical protein